MSTPDAAAVLAMNTLKIVNPEAGCGPYLDGTSGSALTFNGEIYNWQHLAARWGYRPDQDGQEVTDAHLLLWAWQHRGGPAVLDDLDGMFAFGFYDAWQQRFYLVRDRLGEKPLYWRLDGDRLAFASEVAALLEYAPAPIDARPGMLAVESPLGVQTPYAGLQLLEAGHVLCFDVSTSSVTISPWWSLATAAAAGGRKFASAQADYGVAVSDLTDLLRTRVPERVPEVPFALLLSGGLDSALLAYLMRPTVCVTVRYPGHDRLDEHAGAARVAADLGCDLVVVEPIAQEFRDGLGEIVDALGYPMGNASTFSEYAAYRAIADLGIRVVVGGLGPDELLLGYARHALAAHGRSALADGLAAYGPLAAKLPPEAEHASEDVTYGHLVLRGPDPHALVQAMISQTMSGHELGRALTLVDLAVSWRALVLTSDALSSRFGLERRAPFLARDLVEFAYAMPVGHKLQHQAPGKRLLRDCAEALGVPADICRAADKLGFASPVPHWLDGVLSDWCTEQMDAALVSAPAGILRTIIDRGYRPGRDHDRHRMQALITAAWLTRTAAATGAQSVTDAPTTHLRRCR